MSKTEKLNTTIALCIFRKDIYHLKRKELISLLNSAFAIEPNFPKKVFFTQSRKSEHCHSIHIIKISLETKFQIKLTIYTF